MSSGEYLIDCAITGMLGVIADADAEMKAAQERSVKTGLLLSWEHDFCHNARVDAARRVIRSLEDAKYSAIQRDLETAI